MDRPTHRPRVTRTRALVAGGFVLALVAAPFAAALATDGELFARGQEATVEELRTIEQTRLDALVDADMGVASPLHASDFTLVPPPGSPMERDEYLAAVESGDLDYLSFAPVSEIEVRLHGEAAFLRYRSQIDIDAAGIGQLSHEAWHTYLYEKRDGTWQVVWEQATAVGGFPPPGA